MAQGHGQHRCHPRACSWEMLFPPRTSPPSARVSSAARHGRICPRHVGWAHRDVALESRGPWRRQDAVARLGWPRSHHHDKGHHQATGLRSPSASLALSSTEPGWGWGGQPRSLVGAPPWWQRAAVLAPQLTPHPREGPGRAHAGSLPAEATARGCAAVRVKPCLCRHVSSP